MTNAWPWWEKSKATVFPACNSWLNFRVRGQFKVKIYTERHINTTYFIKKYKKTWACDHLKTSNLSADNFKNILDLDVPTPERAIRSSDTGQRIPCFHSCQLITTLMHYQFSCAPKLARKYEIERWSRSSKTINWSADSFQINHITSITWHMSPRYVHVILVSGYPVLTAVNRPYCECPI